MINCERVSGDPNRSISKWLEDEKSLVGLEKNKQTEEY